MKLSSHLPTIHRCSLSRFLSGIEGSLSSSLSLILSLSLNSCTSLELNDPEEDKQLHEVTVSLTGIDFTLDPATRATASEAEITHIALKVFNEDGDEVANVSQIASEAGDNFNKLKIQLTTGTYTFVAVAHDTSADNIGCATITSPTEATLPEGAVPTLYAHVEEVVSITSASDQPITINMGKRINATFHFVSIDNVPDDVSRMVIDINTDGTAINNTHFAKFNPSTGFSTSEYHFLRSFAVEAGAPFDINLNLLLPADERAFPMTIHAQNASNKTIADYDRAFENVPFQRAYVTNASGKFFRYQNSSSLGFDITQGSLDYEY